MRKESLRPYPKDLAVRCPRSGLRYFEQPEIAVWGARTVGITVCCPGCGRSITLRSSPWGVALIPRHKREVSV